MSKVLRGSVRLPGSKSESNRALMIAAYGGFDPEISNLSEANDTKLLQRLLGQIALADSGETSVVDCEDAGAVARFLMTYLASREGSWHLTGTQRLQQRPMGPLVEALRHLGADIECLNEEGMLPLRIQGHPLTGGEVTLDGSQSSQFASSLLLSAPMWEKGLVLTLKGELVSMPYLEMTLSMMRHFGALIRRDGMTVSVSPKPYVSRPWEVSADWSAASYWYELAALSDACSIVLKDLHKSSLQGDKGVAELFAKMGVSTQFEADGACLVKDAGNVIETDSVWDFDFTDTPDLFPAVFVACVALHRKSVFRGIRHLALKESVRVESIIIELSKIFKFNYKLEYDSIVIDKSLCKCIDDNISILYFNTHSDHRIAMALAPLIVRFPRLVLDDPSVVAKSYPSYWIELESLME
ncbi:MAG: 3-phosphoshikimate 1-carboxyvinyltransferase [Bacteroidales bacterium]|nr:3-phosphoshikimate 1-carboxyvinyltransferase [Bacteroidales bacterium]